MSRVVLLLLLLGVFIAGLASSPGWAGDAKQVYQNNCVACHGANGKGDGPAAMALKPKPGDFSAILQGKADADIAKVIKEGGAGAGKSPLMPAFKNRLADGEVAELVQYLKQFSSR